MSETTPNAGDFEWRSVLVRINPVGERAYVTVTCERKRGIDTVWSARLLTRPVEWPEGAHLGTVDQALHGVVLTLLQVLDRVHQP